MSWVVDGRDFVALAHQWLADRITGYKPDPSGVLDGMVETGALIAQEVNDVFGADVLPGIESALLERDGFTRRAAVAAQGTIDIEADTVGPHSIAAGETFIAGGIDWVLTAPLTIGVGLTTGTAAVQAVEAGAAANAITTADAVPIATTSWIDTAEITRTTDGLDEETVDEHLARGRKLKRITSAQLILPQDFADFVEIFVPGVARACVYDGYNPDDGTTGNERYLTASFIDGDGEWVGETIRQDARDAVFAQRESSFRFRTAEPTYTTINCAFTFTTLPGVVPSEAKAAAEANVTDALSPAFHGLPRTPDEPAWRRVTLIDRREIETVVQNTPGVDRLTALTLNGGTADISLSGAFPLPRAGTVVGTPS